MSDAGKELPGTAPEPEEVARANLYGLVSRLFYAPADPNLLAEISHAPVEAEEDGTNEGKGMAAAWHDLREACRTAYPAIVRQEYDGLFIGVGKAAVTPYLSGFAEPDSPDRYLVRLRQQLDAWGLARRDSVFEVEDHISGACDVMRWLIESARPLAEQRAFFENFVYLGAVPFCGAVQQAPSTVFYQHVANFALHFFEVEKAAFEMEDGDVIL
jgi:TorA maturation chaperone TorD